VDSNLRMGRRSPSFLLALNHSLIERYRYWLWVPLLLLAIPMLINHFILLQIETTLSLRVNQKPIFFALPGQIYLNDKVIVWEDKLKVLSGKLYIEVSWPFSSKSKPKVTVEGRDLNVEFDKTVSGLLGTQTAKIDQIKAIIVLLEGRNYQIEKINLKSDQFKFDLNKSVA
jgi:hypothetical protein